MLNGGFWQALAYMGDDFMFQLFGKYLDMANAVKNPCHLNLAACMLKIHRFEEAIGHCSVVCKLFMSGIYESTELFSAGAFLDLLLPVYQEFLQLSHIYTTV